MLEISLEVLGGRKLLERKDLWLRTVPKSQEEELPGVCVVPSVAGRCGGEAVNRLDDG